MRVLIFLWLIVMTILAVGHGAMVVSHPIPRSAILLLTLGSAIVVAVFVSVGLAVVVMSLVALIWGLYAYFYRGRFAGPAYRIGLAKNPVLLRSTTFLCFASSVVAFIVFVAWYLAFIPIVVWLALGFLTVEMAIHRHIRALGMVAPSANGEPSRNRSLAISAINHFQGWRNEIVQYRYPFLFAGLLFVVVNLWLWIRGRSALSR
jgi:hypothetical protein